MTGLPMSGTEEARELNLVQFIAHADMLIILLGNNRRKDARKLADIMSRAKITDEARQTIGSKTYHVKLTDGGLPLQYERARGILAAVRVILG